MPHRDHRDVMVSLAKREGWQRGVEVGLGHGNLFSRLIGAGLEMIGVDLGLRPERREQVKAIGGNVLWMASVQAAEFVEDGWADFVFIDAGHSFNAVQADLEAWERKVRPGGWFGGHDYHWSHPGVIRAIGERWNGAHRVLEHAVWARA